MQAGGGWFVPWTMGVQKFAVALPMGGVVPLVPPLLAALPPAPPPLRLIAPPLQHQSQSGRKKIDNRVSDKDLRLQLKINFQVKRDVYFIIVTWYLLYEYTSTQLSPL
ncbi:unnamed protein product [Euphydryas editha]|uniref:Uncharacterized protein n=1 Tax=Euphydryas editha TaxID=104508 RepID=A0AAU9V4B2_EUPED|nr:unnamed protein product [Euphydryas editha]